MNRYRAAPALAAALFAATCVAPRGLLSARLDTTLYEEFGTRVLDGAIPYRDFSLEYPPGALPVFVLPALAPDYATAFKLLMALVGAAAVAVCVATLVRLERRIRAVVVGAVVAAITPLALGPVTLIRFDLWPSLLVVAALAAMISGRAALGGAVLGAAVTAKLYPLALVPLAVAYFRRVDRRRAVVAGIGASALVVAPFAAVGAGGLAFSLERQLGRGLEIESLGASVLLSLHQLGAFRAEVAPRSGSYDLVGGTADSVAAAATVLQAFAVGFVWLQFTRGRRDAGDLAAAAAAAVAAFVAFGKVLSPQFLLWLIPLVPLVSPFRVAAGATLIAAALLTHALYPGRHEELVDLGGAETWLLLARNAAVVSLFAILAAAVRARTRGAQAAARGS